MPTPKTGVFHSAIRLDPGFYGTTGLVEYIKPGEWHFWPDDEYGRVTLLSRGEFRIPSLDRHNMLPAKQNSYWDRMFRERPKPPPGVAEVAQGMKGIIGNGRFMDKLSDVLVEFNDQHGVRKAEVLKECYLTKTKLT